MRRFKPSRLERKRRPSQPSQRPIRDLPPINREALEEFLKKVRIAPDEELEEASMVVCMPNDSPSYFSDDVYTTCAECGVGIHHRPYMPKKPKKVCIECAVKLMDEEKKARGEDNAE